MRHPCGCVVEVHGPSGVLRSVAKCRKHLALSRDPATLDAAYYTELGVIDPDGRPRATAHVAELTEALGPIPPEPGRYHWALEVGCGASPYIRAIREAGYRWIGIDPSPWVREWADQTHDATAYVGRFEDADHLLINRWSLILAAHSLEHMDDAPAAVARMAGMLEPGGELWIVVPDDSDPTNPDHLWMFTLDTLRDCVEAAGLTVGRFALRRYVKHENFLYLRARKPD